MKLKDLLSVTAVLLCVIQAGCGSVDVERMKIREIRESNEKTGRQGNAVYVTEEDADKRERERKEKDLNVITTKDEVFIPVDSQTQKPLSREQAVTGSMREALVTPQNFTGGTMFYDYNENKQYPVVCKVLGLTVIQLENNEVPIGVPYLSDTMRWEVTGDVWRTIDGMNVQIVMLKPLEAGLTTNMVLITNMRIYQFILTSTRDSYMPMVKFKYPLGMGKFITAATIRDEEAEKEREKGGYFLSYNYRITGGWFLSGWFKPEWMPTEAWDDGHKTYVKLPRGVLQMEYPVVFERGNYIINYRVSDNVMILDKLVRKITLKLDGKRVVIEKLKGEANDLRRYVKREVEVIGDKPPLNNGVRFEISGDVPWLPEKVMEYDGETYIYFKDNVFNGESVMYVIDEKKNHLEYRQVGNVIIIPKVIRKAQLAYDNQLLTITRK
jgi:type IV secretion system protein VirB9